MKRSTMKRARLAILAAAAFSYAIDAAAAPTDAPTSPAAAPSLAPAGPPAPPGPPTPDSGKPPVVIWPTLTPVGDAPAAGPMHRPATTDKALSDRGQEL